MCIAGIIKVSKPIFKYPKILITNIAYTLRYAHKNEQLIQDSNYIHGNYLSKSPIISLYNLKLIPYLKSIKHWKHIAILIYHLV